MAILVFIIFCIRCIVIKTYPNKASQKEAEAREKQYIADAELSRQEIDKLNQYCVDNTNQIKSLEGDNLGLRDNLIQKESDMDQLQKGCMTIE